jgi:chemotaxis protein methyltransferase CheR
VPHLSDDNFRAFSRWIERELGIKMPAHKSVMLRGRLARRVRALGLASFDDYRRHVFEGGSAVAEITHLVDAVTTNKTDFFREPKQLDAFASRLVPGGPLGRRYLVWSAGCSTGEEPYTLAMLLAERARAASGFDYALLATDISTQALDAARQAIYPAELAAPVPANLRARYLRNGTGRSEGLVRVVPELRRRVTFHRLNFMDDDYRARDSFDVIFFRNVAIYFDKDTQAAVVRKLCAHLRPDGHVIIGQSESVTGLDVPLEPIAPAIYRKV